MWRFWSLEMSSDGDHTQGHIRLVTFVYVPFSPSLLLILALQHIVFLVIVAEGHYMLCSMEEF